MGRGGFWSLGDKRGQQLWLSPRLLPQNSGGITWGGEFLGGNKAGAAVGLGWRRGVCSLPARRERFPAPSLQTPWEEGRLGASGLSAGCGSHLLCSSVGATLGPATTAPSLGTAPRLRAGEDLAWRKPSLVGKTSGLLHNSCWGGGNTRSEDLTRLHRHGARAGAGLAAGAPESRV